MNHTVAPYPDRKTVRRSFLLGVAVVIVDQATKTAAPLAAGTPLERHVLPSLNHEFTLGVAAAPLATTILAAIVMLLAFGGYVVRLFRLGRLSWWSPALLIGGALGNLIDRILFGAVRDFLLVPGAIINLADIAVLVGLSAYLTLPLRREHLRPLKESPPLV